MSDQHHYRAHLIWEGNHGDGTADYDSYGREYRVVMAGKPDLEGTADVAFRGAAGKVNPEELFLAAVSACHMLTYLALCARQRISVIAYEDEAAATLGLERDGGGSFREIVLRPVVSLAVGAGDGAARAERAARLHDRAGRLCFIANSCRVPIRHLPTIRTAEAGA